MPTNSLTDAKCRGVKPTDKPQKIFDGEGLHLFVAPTGSKVWRLAYRLDGKPKTMSFGPYPAVGLAEARQKRDQAKATLRDGLDPMQSRKARKTTLTLDQASAQYWAGRNDITASYRAHALRAIELHLSPHIGSMEIGQITRQHLLDALLLMNAKGLHEFVRKTRMWVGQVFDWAVELGHAEINPAALIKPEKAFGKKQVEHFAALELHEMPEFMRRLDVEGDLQSVLALRLLALTWVRTNELRFMRWDEIQGDTWLIPAGKMKRRRDHVVPLSPAAIEILKKLRQRSGSSVYVFPAEHRGDRPISENAVLALLYRMGYKGRMTGHGLRSVGSTWANDAGYPPDVIERQLAHVPTDVVRSAYNRAQYIDQRRAMLEAWAGWLKDQPHDAPDPDGR